MHVAIYPGRLHATHCLLVACLTDQRALGEVNSKNKFLNWGRQCPHRGYLGRGGDTLLIVPMDLGVGHYCHLGWHICQISCNVYNSSLQKN